MVKITNGKNIFEVTRGAFDGIYSRQGYVLVEENKSAEQNNKESQVPEMTDDQKFLNEIIEKPVSQWTKEEIKRFAAMQGIDISGTKNAGEAKELIKKFLESEDNE